MAIPRYLGWPTAGWLSDRFIRGPPSWSRSTVSRFQTSVRP